MAVTVADPRPRGLGPIGSGEGGGMRRSLRAFVDGLRARTEARRRRALRGAVAEMERREKQEGSIWRSGKGGYHHDR